MADRSPSRPWRARNIVLAVLALVVVSLVVWNVYRFATREPAPIVDYAAKLQGLAEDRQPEGENGWLKFVEAAQIAAEIEGEVRAGEYSYAGRGPGFGQLDFSFGRLDPLDHQRIEPELTALAMLGERGVHELLAEGAACPRMIQAQPSNAMLITMMLPELAQLRQLARMLTLEMRLAALDGDDARRVRTFEHLLALGRASAGQAILINQLVGMAIVALTMDELRAELDEAGIDPETGRALLEAMDRQLGPMLPMEAALEGERLLVLDTIQTCFTDDGHGDGRLDMDKLEWTFGGMGSPGGGALNAFRGAILAGRADTTRVANEFFDAAIAQSRLDPLSRRDAAFDAEAFVNALGFRYTLITNLVPALSKGVRQEDRHRLNLQATRTLIAIEMFRSMHGRLPVSLDELAPEILPEPPVDPLHGGPFVYRVTGETYEFYSTGLDQTDDSAGLDPAQMKVVRSDGAPDKLGTDVELKRVRDRRDP